MSALELGELKVFSQKFTTTAGVDADPVTVELWVREEIDGTELQWIFTPPATAVLTPAGFSAIVRDSAGDFHVDYTGRKPERVTAQWVGAGTVLVHPPETVFVRHSQITALEP